MRATPAGYRPTITRRSTSDGSRPVRAVVRRGVCDGSRGKLPEPTDRFFDSLPNLLGFLVILLEAEATRYVDRVLAGADAANGLAKVIFRFILVFFLFGAIGALHIPASDRIQERRARLPAQRGRRHDGSPRPRPGARPRPRWSQGAGRMLEDAEEQAKRDIQQFEPPR